MWSLSANQIWMRPRGTIGMISDVLTSPWLLPTGVYLSVFTVWGKRGVQSQCIMEKSSYTSQFGKKLIETSQWTQTDATRWLPSQLTLSSPHNREGKWVKKGTHWWKCRMLFEHELLQEGSVSSFTDVCRSLLLYEERGVIGLKYLLQDTY